MKNFLTLIIIAMLVMPNVADAGLCNFCSSQGTSWGQPKVIVTVAYPYTVETKADAGCVSELTTGRCNLTLHCNDQWGPNNRCGKWKEIGPYKYDFTPTDSFYIYGCSNSSTCY